MLPVRESGSELSSSAAKVARSVPSNSDSVMKAAVVKSTGAEGRTVYRKVGRGSARRALAALALVALPALESCQTVPITGRTAINAFSQQDDLQLGAEAYDQILAGQPLVKSGADAQMVQRAMQRLVAVADDRDVYDWEVNLIADDATVNAFALPGGKMAVYTGILDVAGSEAGLAVVMGHEIGHVVARHGTERMTHALGYDIALQLIGAGDYEALAGDLINVVLGLPNSRKHELEADRIGLIYMARAGYDPREAVVFWERMSQGGSAPPEILSTHPSDESRIAQLEAFMDEALQEWQQAGGQP